MRCLAISLLAAAAVSAQDPGAQWVQVPGAWDTAEGLRGHDGFAWYRCVVHVPEDWTDDLSLALGRIDDCDETFFNGRRVGATGAMPPKFASAREVERDYTVPAAHVRAGAPNLIAVRVYDGGGAEGGIAGDLELSSAAGSMPLRGTWRITKGDDQKHASWPADAGAGDLVTMFRGAAQRPGIPVLRRTRPSGTSVREGLWSDRPAHDASEAFAIGDGSLVFGGLEAERVLLRLAGQEIGELRLTFPGSDAVFDFERTYEGRDGFVRVRHAAGGVDHTREYYASFQLSALVLDLQASTGPVSVLANLFRHGATTAVDDAMLVFDAQLDEGQHVAAALGVVGDAEVRAGKGLLRVRAEQRVTLVVAMLSGDDAAQLRKTCMERVRRARQAGRATLRAGPRTRGVVYSPGAEVRLTERPTAVGRSGGLHRAIQAGFLTLRWRHGRLQSAVIEATKTGLCRVSVPDGYVVFRNGNVAVPIERPGSGVIEFATEAGRSYELRPR